MGSDLAQLIEAGRLHVGDTLYHPKRPRTGGGTVTARVTKEGLEVGGRNFHSPSTAAASVAGYAVNGWTYWHLRPSGEVLASLRGQTR